MAPDASSCVSCRFRNPRLSLLPALTDVEEAPADVSAKLIVVLPAPPPPRDAKDRRGFASSDADLLCFPVAPATTPPAPSVSSFLLSPNSESSSSSPSSPSSSLRSCSVSTLTPCPSSSPFCSCFTDPAAAVSIFLEAMFCVPSPARSVDASAAMVGSSCGDSCLTFVTLATLSVSRR